MYDTIFQFYQEIFQKSFRRSLQEGVEICAKNGIIKKRFFIFAKEELRENQMHTV